MPNLRARGKAVRRFILENVGQNPSTIARLTAEKFEISRQAANRHLKRLVDEEALLVAGNTRSRTYRLRPLLEWSKTYDMADQLEEDVVWRRDIEPRTGEMPSNVNDIGHYGFTETPRPERRGLREKNPIKAFVGIRAEQVAAPPIVLAP